MKELIARLCLLTGLLALGGQTACDDGSGDSAGADGDADADSDSDGDADGDSDSDSASEMVTPTIQLTVAVPDDFDGVPETLDTFFFESKDVSVEPYAMGETIHNPDIGIGDPLTIEVGQVGLTGEYYMAVVLYCQGGGDGEDLVPGVDWVGMVDGPLCLDPRSGAVDAGEIELFLFEPEEQ